MKKIILFLVAWYFISPVLAQNSGEAGKRKTITIRVPNIKVKPNISAGFVSHGVLGGSIGYGLNAQLNFVLAKYFYVGVNSGIQETGHMFLRDEIVYENLKMIGGAFGVNIPLKPGLVLALGGNINKSRFTANKQSSNQELYYIDCALKYALSKRVNFINKIQFGGGTVRYFYDNSYYNYSRSFFDADYRALNFLFGVEF